MSTPVYSVAENITVPKGVIISYPFNASAPPTISKISLVIAA